MAATRVEFVEDLLPSIYQQLRDLTARDEGCMQDALGAARRGWTHGAVAYVIDSGIVLSWQLLHSQPSWEWSYSRVPGRNWAVQGWTRQKYRNQGLATELMKIWGVKRLGRAYWKRPQP